MMLLISVNSKISSQMKRILTEGKTELYNTRNFEHAKCLMLAVLKVY